MRSEPIFVIILLFFSMFMSGQKSGDLDFSYTSQINDTISYKRYLDHLNVLVSEKRYEEAENLADVLIKKGLEFDYKNGLGRVFISKGRIAAIANRNVEADQNYSKAIVYFKESNSLQGLAMIYNDKFIEEERRGNLEKAADYLHEAKMYYEKAKDSFGLSSIYNNLAMLYSDLKDIKSSEAYYLKSIALKKALNVSGVGVIINNLALLNVENNQLKEAKKLLLEAKDINKKENNMRNTAQSYSILAKLYLFNKEYDIAEKYYDTTLCIATQTNFDLLSLNAKQQLGLIALHKGKYLLSEQLFEESRKGFVKLNAVPLLLKNYQFSFKLDSTKGNLIGAIKWQKEYQKLSDKRINDITAKKIANTEDHYKAELEQYKLLEEQKVKERLAHAKMLRYKTLTYIAIGVILLILVFLVFIIKVRIERKRLIVKLNESNQIKNKLFSIISHDLKNEVSGLDSTLKLLNESTLSVEEFNEIIPLLANRTNQTWIMLNNLLNWSRSQLNELNAKPTVFDVNELIVSKFEFFKAKADQKNIQLINKLSATSIYADMDMVSIVAQNLISNAIKFCNEGDSIALMSIENDKYYEICFKDSGVGIDPSHINKLFSEETFTTAGTQNESGTGLGLKICKELIALNKGHIKVESEVGKGSTFYISLPKAA